MFFHKKSKNAAKMNKIVQKWQFWMTFYTTMKMEVGISLNGPNKWFPPYWFLIAQHMKYQKIIMRAPVHFFWVVTTLGLQCREDRRKILHFLACWIKRSRNFKKILVAYPDKVLILRAVIKKYFMQLWIVLYFFPNSFNECKIKYEYILWPLFKFG